MSLGNQYLPRPYLILKKELELDLDNVEYKLLKNKTKVELLETKEQNKYSIPEDIKPLLKETPYLICFDIWEAGGGYTNTGNSTIIAGLSGKRLKPFKILTRGQLANAEHACFSIPYACVVMECDSDYDIEISRVSIKEDDGEITVSEKRLWHGSAECLSNKFKHYKHAVKAAIDKRSCYHCRSPHYIME